MADGRFYLTTPIYYVNGEPHIGHAYTTIMADIIARHHRQRGEDVFFLTGTDEHGGKIVRSAEREGRTPREQADVLSERFRALGGVLDATYDFFIRTTDPEHEAEVQRILERVHESGDVYRGSYGGWYCSSCERFYGEDELVEGRRCPIHGTPVEWLEEENWFFRLSAYRERLLAHYDANPGWVLPAARRNEARRMIEDGLDDLSVSRAQVEWGVPVPWDPGQTVYVWIDALLNYRTALGYARPGEDLEPLLAAGPAAHGQGHPQVPRRHLAGAADGRRPRAAPPADDPRLRPQGRREDEQDHRQRGRPVPVHRARTASTRCATTSPARCASARTAPSPPRASRRATRRSWPTSWATS